MRPGSVRILAAGLVALLAFAAFGTLSGWQVHRLAWKRKLKAEIASRIMRPPVDLLRLGALPANRPTDWEYRRVRVEGRFVRTRPALVQATTIRGAGWWVMSPLRLTDGSVLLVNRGFAPGRGAFDPPQGERTVTGLLRASETGTRLLRRNDPVHDRWFVRDVYEIAGSRGIPAPHPFFVDAEAGRPGEMPVGGMTVIALTDNHLAYALTWAALACLSAAAFVAFVRLDRSRGGTGDA